jgi:hypothetical protein
VQLAFNPQCAEYPAPHPLDQAAPRGAANDPLAVSKDPIPPCQILLTGATVAPPDALQVNIQKTTIYLAALQKYAAALAAVATSTDSDTLSKNVTSLNSGLTQLGATVATGYPNVKPPEQTAVSGAGALGDLFDLYLNSMRFQALRDSVHHANPIVADVAALVSPTFNLVAAKVNDQLAEQLSAMPIMVKGRAEKMTGKDRTAAIVSAHAKANQINTLRAAAPADAAAALAAAHATLDQALQGAKSEADVARAMAAFLKAAQAAQTSFTQATTSLGQ